MVRSVLVTELVEARGVKRTGENTCSFPSRGFDCEGDASGRVEKYSERLLASMIEKT